MRSTGSKRFPLFEWIALSATPTYALAHALIMPSTPPDDSPSDETRPWQQQLYDSIWLIALVAILFFVLSYVVWGLVDILTVPTG